VNENWLRVLHKFSDNSGIEILEPISIDTIKNIITIKVNQFSEFDLVVADAVSVAAVPEPASLAIWGSLGLVGLIANWRRRGKKAI
jgi:hypothetical protein